MTFVFQLNRPLRFERDVPRNAELNRKRITVERFEQAALQPPMHFHRCADDLKRL